MVETLFFIALLAFGVTVGVFMVRFQYRRGDALLAAWAARESYSLLSQERANPPGTGPMDRWASNRQIFYRVNVQDAAGQVRRGIVRVGSVSSGVTSDQVSVTWDA